MGLPSFDARALSENRLCGQIAPPSIASTTHLRKSSEYGFAIHTGLLPVGSLNHIRAGMGIPDSAFSGKALARMEAARVLSRARPQSGAPAFRSPPQIAVAPSMRATIPPVAEARARHRPGSWRAR